MTWASRRDAGCFVYFWLSLPDLIWSSHTRRASRSDVIPECVILKRKQLNPCKEDFCSNVFSPYLQAIWSFSVKYRNVWSYHAFCSDKQFTNTRLSKSFLQPPSTAWITSLKKNTQPSSSRETSDSSGDYGNSRLLTIASWTALGWVLCACSGKLWWNW